jgi:hypothetical protein
VILQTTCILPHAHLQDSDCCVELNTTTMTVMLSVDPLSIARWINSSQICSKRLLFRFGSVSSFDSRSFRRTRRATCSFDVQPHTPSDARTINSITPPSLGSFLPLRSSELTCESFRFDFFSDFSDFGEQYGIRCMSGLAVTSSLGVCGKKNLV